MDVLIHGMARQCFAAAGAGASLLSSPVCRRSSFAKSLTSASKTTRPAHGDIRSSSDDPLALARRRGTTAGRAVFELPFLRLHGPVADPHATPRQTGTETPADQYIGAHAARRHGGTCALAAAWLLRRV